MVVTILDLLAALALIALVRGLGAATFRATVLLARLVPPRSGWRRRGVVLAILALAYIGLIALDVPGVLASLAEPGEQATVASVARTIILAAWLWTLTTILLMLARGKLADAARWRDA